MSSKALEILQKYWLYNQFRNPQDKIIDEVLEGRDCLALLPTGGGKSVCYQVPALVKDGIAIVVSPLIALMKDQVAQLKSRQIKAEAIYSGLHSKDIDRILDNCIYGDIKLLYVSPERLKSTLFLARFEKMNVSLIAVDEAHCISQWGYDFRPSYLKIADVRQLKPNVPILALTATATKKVALDIQKKLNFKSENLIQKSFYRENLSFVLMEEDDKEKFILHLLSKMKGCGLIYARSRAKTQEISYYLNKRGIKATHYHAGLSASVRSKAQDAWISDEIRVIVGTNAFGMGIDKPDVRTVIHYDLPPSPEEYFQEAGRAGRDGEEAYCILLYNEKDKEKANEFFKRSFPPLSFIGQVYRSIGVYLNLALGSGKEESFVFDIIKFAENYRYHATEVFYALKNLEKEGYILLSDGAYTSSQLNIRTDKTTLYNYQLNHPFEDRLLKSILRIYEGLFSSDVKISESKIAKVLKISTAKVVASLNKMQEDNLIIYKASNQLPQLTFLTERLPSNNLSFDKSMLSFRKEQAQHRLQNMLDFLSSDTCRANYLLKYFDEEIDGVCGKCDICLGSNIEEMNNAEFDKMKNQVLEIISSKQIKYADISYYFPFNKKTRLLKLLDFLANESIIKIEKGRLLLSKENNS